MVELVLSDPLWENYSKAMFEYARSMSMPVDHIHT